MWIRVIKRLFITIIVMAIVLFLLLLMDRDSKDLALSEEEKDLINAVKAYSKDVDSIQFKALTNAFGNNKKFPPQYQWQCLLALSHYPELKETTIDFEVRPAFVPLYSWPEPISVIFPWIDRSFRIVISTESGPYFDPILFHKLPFNDQVGVIGHELAHTVFYQNKTSLETVITAVRYQFNQSFHIKLERDADFAAIAHGLGYQLYDYAFFVRKAFGRSLEQILSERGNTYLSPAEIAYEMKKYPFYLYSLNSGEHYFK